MRAWRKSQWAAILQQAPLLPPKVPVPTMSEVTRILSAIERGDAHAAEELLPLVYDELRKLAADKMAQEKPGQTLEATALVHEAYVRRWTSTSRSTGTAAAISLCGGRGDAPHSWSSKRAAGRPASTAVAGCGSPAPRSWPRPSRDPVTLSRWTKR